MSQGTALTPFAYNDHPVRVVQLDGEPWFVATDVCVVLGYAHTASALRTLRDSEKGVRRMHTLGGEQDITILSEAGLYRLIMRSNRDEAGVFQDWVTQEVLPAIRKTGRYAVAEPTRADLARMVLAAEAEREALEQQVAELAPKAAAVDEYMDAYGLELLGTVAKMLHVRERVLRRFLFDQHILIEHGERRNDPMAEYVDCGYFEVKTRVVGRTGRGLAARTTFVTPRGVEFIRRRLVAAGVVSGGGQQLVLA